MAHVEHSTDPLTGLTVYSLYGGSEKDLAPRRELLRQLDALVIDLQDIGSRYYTFIYTMALCMREAAPLGVQVIVLDRPNPIDGVHLEGNIREEKYSSFVGMFPLPTRHGMTAGELARYFNKVFAAELRSRSSCRCAAGAARCGGATPGCRGSSRRRTCRRSTPPRSIPACASSRGRTSAKGAARRIRSSSSARRGSIRSSSPSASTASACRASASVRTTSCRRSRSTPARSAAASELHVTNRAIFEPYRTGLWCVKVARDMDPEQFDWRRETYEFVSDRLAIDLLAGSARYRRASSRAAATSTNGWRSGRSRCASSRGLREEFLLYRSSDADRLVLHCFSSPPRHPRTDSGPREVDPLEGRARRRCRRDRRSPCSKAIRPSSGIFTLRIKLPAGAIVAAALAPAPGARHASSPAA